MVKIINIKNKELMTNGELLFKYLRKKEDSDKQDLNTERMAIT
jgi:hypothetical protein